MYVLRYTFYNCLNKFPTIILLIHKSRGLRDESKLLARIITRNVFLSKTANFSCPLIIVFFCSESIIYRKFIYNLFGLHFKICIA